MNKHLQNISDLIQQDKTLSAEQKVAVLKSLKDADKELEITSFKLDRTEKVKRTTAILLEETIEELEQKRKAVEAQNKELEIETSLERVRTIAMGMRKPDDLLDICQTLFAELHTLGFSELRNAMINIFDNDSISFLNYDYSDNAGKTITTYYYDSHPVIEKHVREIRSSNDAFSETVFAGKDLDEWRAFRKEKGEKDDPKMDNILALFYYFYSIGTGAIGISTYSPISKDKLSLLKRFRNVFILCYQRYTDIWQAEEQAHESQIQLALERVRARTMAMHKSDELIQTAELLFDQLKQLGAESQGVAFAICDKNSPEVKKWTSIGKFSVPYTLESGEQHMYEAWKNQIGIHEEVYEGERLKRYYELFMEIPAFKEGIQKVIDDGQPIPTWQKNHAVIFKQGYLLIITLKPFNKPQIFLRFAKVFEQTYTRFLDLQKAESQTRESQIQLALERVRARTMAMQRSDELADASLLLDSQVRSLGIKTWGCAFNIYGDNQSSEWFSSAEGTLPTYKTPREHLFLRYYEAGQRGEKILIQEFEGEKCAAHYEYLCTIPVMGDALRDMIAAGGSFPVRQVDHVVYFKYGYLLFISLEPVPDAHDIFKRFAKVFEQTYTRFLDLQKAEEQAREAKIEAALEKVRSRSLAMHHSEELNEVVTILFEKIKELKIAVTAVGIGIYIDGSKDMNTYVCGENEDRLVISNYCLPYFHHEIWKDLSNAREKQLDFFSGNYSKEEKNSFYKYVLEHSALMHLPDDIKSLIYESPAYIISMAPVNHSMFMINDFEGKILSENEVDIIKRFARVFDQAYTRFLDLQKAETRAREAKIEAALERTRTQSMIMQHSKELDDTLRVFHEQVLLLGIDSAFSFLWLPDEEKDRHIFWAAWAENNSTLFKSKAINYPLDRNEPATKQCLIDWKSNEPVYSYAVPPERVGNYFAAWAELIDGVEKLRPEYFTGGLYYVEAFMKYGCFGVMTSVDLTDGEKKILSRFAIEFERTYTRFLDLQKAEAQARESQVQLALERVRARTMAMHQSAELADTASILFQQIKELGFETWSCGFCTWTKNDMAEVWMAADSGGLLPPMMIPYKEEPTHADIYMASLRGEPAHDKIWEGKGLENHYAFLKTIPSVKAAIDILEKSGLTLPSRQCYYVGFFKEGYLLLITKEPNEALKELSKRFASVFDLTYTRFLDLKKAEAQTRESQIQLALERVRARTMAMQKSDELSETAVLLFHQLMSLELNVKGCGFNIWERDEKVCTSWMSGPDGELSPPFNLPLTEDPLFIRYYESRQQGEDFWVYETGKEELTIRYNHLRTLPVLGDAITKELESGKEIPSFVVDHVVNFSKGNLIFITYERCPEAWDIFRRFGKVFEQTYTRFLDLQKAEAQARESQVQLALERVRARTMAMQHSGELADAATLLLTQVRDLGIKTFGAGFNIWHPDGLSVTSFMANPDGSIQPPFRLPHNENSYFIKISDARQRGKDFFVMESGGEDLEEMRRYMLNLPGVKEVVGNIGTSVDEWPKFQVNHCAFFSQGYLLFVTYEPIPEMWETFKRFAKVFEQTYTRFLDLQKAEAQAREAQIEAALERVRSRSMGMQKSEELKEIIKVVYEQFVYLNIHIEHSGFIIDYKAREDMSIWLADKHLSPSKITIPYFDSPHWNSFKEAKATGKNFFANLLSFEIKNKFYKDLFEFIPGIADDTKDYYFSCAGVAISTVLLENIGLYIENFSAIPYSDEENATLLRFGKVFQQTYTRFLDLQRAEAQALEAIKRASVDRVRAEIASMRTTKDLERIQPLIWNELTTLSIPFIRCGVFIMDEEQQLVHTFLSTPEGKAIATLHVPFQFDLPIITNGVSHWRSKKMYKEYWDAPAFTKSWIALSSLRETSGHTYQQEHPPANLYLHMLPFVQGMLYVGNDEPLNEVELQLVQNLADAFATAYARYEDFNKLEAAKNQVDSTLNELQATQKQLIQSEKMASLGELTAGIAHEIQNPLNFVNNFSEVSKELIEELETERSKVKSERDESMEEEILNDIKQNLEKINHHGKRADSIVKGMLQHSRSTGNVKELTDINALADEYFRLAYHGLRAKDKAFNATLKTDYDETIGKINIIPQDIGRVILNVITNAFYAVNEKQKLMANSYQPIAKVSTRRLNDKVEIRVEDNGNGISQKIVDKIFQPFFTTKPTGQGTGLGLSLAYDIVKAHGGELKVETKEGEGSEFIIQLTVTSNIP